MPLWLWRSLNCVCDSDRVEIATGTYTAYRLDVKIMLNPGGRPEIQRYTQWYAPHVGPILETFTHDGETAGVLLKRSHIASSRQ